MATPTKFIPVNGVKLAYSELGHGPLVLYAHGLTASRAHDARRGLTDFAPVGAQRRFVAYDARGHGESTGTTNAADYAWSALAGDLLGLADQLSPHAPLSAIGLSMGTGTLLHAALARPERFERLVLTAPPTAWETRRAQVDLYSAQAALVEAQGLDALLAMYAQAPIAPIFRDLPDYKIAPDIPSALLPSVFRGAGLADFPSPDALRSVSQPTLILAWATDPGHPVSSAEKLSELLPHAELHVSETSADIRTWGERAARFLAG